MSWFEAMKEAEARARMSPSEGGFQRSAPAGASPFRSLVGAPVRAITSRLEAQRNTPGTPSAALFGPGVGFFRTPYRPGLPPAPVSNATFDAAVRAAGGTPGQRPSAVGEVDWASILAGLEGQRPGSGVDRSLFRLSETPEEAATLAREMADLEARQSAGEVALRAGWGNVQSANAAAAEKARAMRAERGDAAAGEWTQAAQQARDLATERARAAGEFEGRAAIDISPEAGVADWAGFMESQAPAERRLAERQQEILGQDLDWLASMAGAQAEAYVGDLQRQSAMLAFERSREHNLRVQDRIAQERMALAQMEQQATAQAASFSPVSQLNDLVGAAAVMNSPELLAQQLGVTPQQAQQMITNFLRGTTQTVLAANPPR